MNKEAIRILNLILNQHQTQLIKMVCNLTFKIKDKYKMKKYRRYTNTKLTLNIKTPTFNKHKKYHC